MRCRYECGGCRNIKVIVTGMTYNHDCGDEGFGDSIDFTASIVK